MQRRHDSAVLALAAFAALAGTLDARLLPSDVEPFISGGTVSNDGSLPYIVELINKGWFGDHHLGAGALVSADWVLTTAVAAPKKSVFVIAGKSDGSDGLRIKVDKSIVEPSKKILKLVKLKKPVEFTKLMRPANLPSSGTDSSGLEAILAGWGTDRKTLNSVSIKVMSPEQCRLDGVTVDDDQICTSAEGNACKGDDGAPLVVDRHTGAFRLVGIATGTDKRNDKCEKRSVYVNVAKYSSWILSVLYP